MVIMALMLALVVAAFSQSLAIQASKVNANTGAVLFLQATATPKPQDQSEIGSTDGIVAMGGLILLIVILPVLLRRKYWARQTPQ